MIGNKERIIYSEHLELRLKLRGVNRILPQKIYQSAKEHYFDKETHLYIAIERLKYKNKLREFAAVYKKTIDGILLITIHPLKAHQKESRIKSGRWEKI